MKIRWETERGWIEFKSPYVLKRNDGLGVGTVVMNMERSPFQDGAFLTGTYFEPRYVEFEIIILGNNSQQAERRRQLLKIFNPKLEGTLTVTDDNNNNYTITGRAEEIVFPSEVGDSTSPSHQVALISIVAPDPFFKGQEYTLILGAFIGGWQFPFKFPLQWGTMAKFRDINNDGDAPAPLFIELVGELENVLIENQTTGEKVHLDVLIEDGERIEIDTEAKTVIKIDNLGNRTNAFPFLTIDSTLFSLAVGENVLNYSADVEGSNARVIIAYKKRYIGI